MTPLTVKHFADKYGVSEGKVRYTWIEKFGLPTLIRSVSRLSHGRGPVRLERLGKRDRVPCFDTKKPFLAAPPRQNLFHKNLLEKVKKIREVFNDCEFNCYLGPEQAEALIVTSGLGVLFSQEAVRLLGLEKKVGILQMGTCWPLPEALFEKHLHGKKTKI